MIRNNITWKLWLTIIGLITVVLLLLSIFLEQLFDSYFYQAEQDRLLTRTNHMAEVIVNYPQDVALVVLQELALEENASVTLVQPPQSEYVIANVSSEQLEELRTGKTVIERGYSPTWDPKSSQKELSFWVLQPLITHGEISGLLYVIQPVEASTAMEKVQDLLFFSAGLGIVLATGLAFVVSRNLSIPIVQMNKVAERMMQGDFSGKVQVVTGDEVGRLGVTLNTLAYKLEENIDDLEREKEQLASIITSMTDGVISADLNGAITLANPPARRFIRAQQLAEIGNPSDKQLPRDLFACEQQVMHTGQTLVDELNWQGRVLVVTMAPLYEKDGDSLRGVVAVLRDITDERMLDKMRRDFIANVSHELRTPLAMMQGYSEALLDEFGDDPEQREELTNIILDETHRMRRLVNDLLDLAQLEAGQFQMHEEQIDMEHLIRRIGRKFTTVAHERNVALQVEITPDERPATVLGDSDRLEQVFTNLLDNAFRHTPQGGRITLAMAREDMVLRVCVKDTGEGIPPDDLPHVWDRFYKVDKARTRSKGGTGLGLAITYNIVKNHHGDIVVDSEVGRGTSFDVLLPIAPA
ncbi:two-component system sensor histidine kinase ResE [Tumebacillus sp. BK434]|uniref:ATP-binding protein n=1 Tax=Tumebacillus sp. BK434 TaxID=2512169 RepID=UPI00104A9558|nr:ATP-binding protein [Tumebacillus sp. BK434]TCP59511.1 two-component system sensor histidine kinase ResE [Tumebacillus sp. BK434]